MAKRYIKRFFITLSILYIGICALVYFFQEKIIFHPEKLDSNYEFNFERSFEEFDIEVTKETNLNALLFRADSSKGIVIHFHGNAGSIRGWGENAINYNRLNYDLFVYDYRGFGKSDGIISSEIELFNDAQIIYDFVKSKYSESQIIIEGYSIGSGIATKIAEDNKPNQLILCAPYYSLKDLMTQKYSFLPTFLLKYPLNTFARINEINCPITLFHGTIDAVIPFDSSERLAELLNDDGAFIPLEGCGHNNVQGHTAYLEGLERILGGR